MSKTVEEPKATGEAGPTPARRRSSLPLGLVIALLLWLAVLGLRAAGNMLPVAGLWQGGTPSGTVIDALSLSKGQMLAGGPRGLFFSRDGGNSWSEVGELQGQSVTALAAEGTRFFVATLEGLWEGAPGNWGRGSLPGKGAVSSLLPWRDRLLATTDEGLFSRSLAGESTWSRLWPADGRPAAVANTVIPRGDGLLLGTDDGVMESGPGATSWEFAGLSGARVMGLAVGEGWLYAAIAEPRGDMARSVPGSGEWEWAGLPADGAAAVLVHPGRPSRVYAGLSGLAEQNKIAGVVASDDAGATWSPVRTRLLNVHVPALAFDAEEGILYAATNGGGVYWYREPTAAHRVFDGLGAILDLAEPILLGMVALLLLLSRRRTGPPTPRRS